ncbi:energy transducer TonB [Marinimicrobium sp. C2-29]|uniref:energy transducer TonB n=1 Tax=Marinimicrobium sp. C2-29 TaxID=3139825 RepID=UPI0031390F2D
MKKVAIGAVLALGLGTVGQVTADDYQPAGFADGTLEYLESALASPALTEDYPVASVYCQAAVDEQGSSSDVACYERDGFDQLRLQVEEAFTGRRFTPARVDGETAAVRMVFRVVYADLEGQPPIMILPNLGLMQGEFGYQYSAPQELLGDRNWYALYQSDGRGEGNPFFRGEGRKTRVEAWVNANGRVASARRLQTHGRYKRDAKVVERALEDSRFIPGMVSGEPERMRYVAVLSYPQ